MKFLVILVTVLIVVTPVLSKEEKKSSSILGALINNQPNKDKILGGILKGVLENYHLTKKELNNEVSKSAFDLYLERVDYGKQFLLQKDVKEIKKFKKEFDDQMIEGRLQVVETTSKIMKERINMVKKHIDETLKKDLNLKEKDKYETDAEKRKFVSSEKELKKRWTRLMKYEVLSQYFDILDEQNGVSKDKNKKKKKVVKKKKEKKKSEKELMASAREKVKKRYDRVFKRLLEEKHSDQIDKFYNSIARVYDPHTLYLIPEEKEDFDIDMSGKLEGIGALLREEGSYIKVERIIPGSASWKGKELKAEDIILGVGQDNKDFVDIVDMGIRDAVKLIRGPKGTTVYLKVKKPEGTKKTISIVRDKVVLEESYVKSSTLELEGTKTKVGYIFVPKFYRDFQDTNGRNSSDDVKKELIKLKKTDAKAVILDLRNNGGGALVDATLMGGLFIDKGPIVQVKRTGTPDVKYDVDGKIYWDKPLVVLVNRFSASASEIVAAAMKDYKRAIIVGSGEQTHGKGTVQAILDLNEFVSNRFMKLGPIGAMKITTDMFYRINGMSTQFRGVHPHIVLPDQFGFMDTGEKSLDHAIPYAEVGKVKYDTWKNDATKNLRTIKKNSEKRVKKNKKFKLISESVAWSKKRKEDTVRPIYMKGYKAFREETRKQADKFDDDTVNDKIKVGALKKQKSKMSEVEKESFKEFKETLQKDPVIEETLYIIKDLLKS